MKRGYSMIKWTLLLIFLGFAVTAKASILDQNNPPNNLGLNDSLEWQQQVTVGIGGQLAGIVLYTSSGVDTDSVKIGLGPGPYSGPWAFTTTVGIGSSGTFIDTSSADIFLNPGDVFVIDVSGGPGCCNLSGSEDPYSGGDLYLDIDGQFTDYTQLFGYSMAFQTYMNPGSQTPEPGGFMLLGTGLIGVAGFFRRRLGL